jgi:aminoglycoside phosphotransferase (APT) family kinase protein
MSRAGTRQGVYYWKCDRAAVFHGTESGAARVRPGLDAAVRALVAREIGSPVAVRIGGGQGNHLTFIATVADREYFVRIEDGPEGDDYIEVESFVMGKLRGHGVPVPEIFACDASRSREPFAWQVMSVVREPDLNRHFKAGTLEAPVVAQEIGRLVARWQGVPVEGFGFFDVETARTTGVLRGTHARYEDYFFTRLAAHLEFLVSRGLLTAGRAREFLQALEESKSLLALPHSCLVHKDLALWNVLGTERTVTAVIDWDDCVAGDAMDDLALLGCFHDGDFLRSAFTGYESVRPLPADYRGRFWAHLLRNMIFKAVIRVGAGYFDRKSDFFLLGAAGGGALRSQTIARLDAAYEGLTLNLDPRTL